MASRSKSILILIVVLAVIGIAAFALWLNQQKAAPSVTGLTELMPEDTTVAFIARGMPALLEDFRVEELVQEVKERSPEFREQLEKMQEELGFDPSSQQDVLAFGIDPLRPMGIAVRMESLERVTTFLYVPISDQEDFDTNVRGRAEEQGIPFEDMEVDGRTFTKVAGELLYTHHRDYLVGASLEAQGSSAEDLAPVLNQLLDGELGSARNASWYQSLDPLVDEAWKMLVLVNMDLPEEIWRMALAQSDMELIAGSLQKQLEAYQGIGVALDLTPDHLRLRTRFTVKEDADIPALDSALGASRDALMEQLPGTAFGAVRLAVDLAKTVEQTRELYPDLEEMMQEGLDQMRRSMNVDLEEDVLAYLGSPISLAVLEETGGGPVPVGGAFWLPLKSGHDLPGVIASLRESMGEGGPPIREESGDDATWYVFDAGGYPVRLGFVQEHLVVLAGPTVSEDLAAALTDGGDGSFLDAIERSEIRRGLVGEGEAAFWVSLPTILRVAEENAPQPMPDEARPWLESLGDFYMTSDYQTRSADGIMTLYASEPGGFAEALHEGVKAALPPSEQAAR